MDDFNSEARHLKPSAPPSEETMSRGTGDPVDLFHFDPWLREMDSGCSRECETQERWGFLWNPESLEGFWQCATLTCQ